jgi:hypothetical protein
MPIVKMPDGTLVEMPETLSPEQVTQLKQVQSRQGAEHGNRPPLLDVLGFAGESAKALGRGAVETGISALQNLPFMQMSGLGKPGGEIATQALDQTLPAQPGLWYRGMEGAGGGLISGGAGGLRNLGISALSGAGGGVASAATSEALKEQNPILRKVASLLAGAGAGAGIGFGLGPKQTSGQAALREASQGADFPQAGRNIQTMQQGGMQTGTLAEAFPDQNQLLALALEARNNTGGELLKTRTAGRVQDLQNAGEEFLNRVGPPVNPNAVANEVADAANANLGNLRELRTSAVTNRLANKAVPPQAVSQIYAGLLRTARRTQSPEVADAYRQVAQQLVRPNGTDFVTDLQQLSFQLKRLKENPPTLTASTGRSINANDLKTAIQDAEQHLGRISKDFREAMEDYGSFSRQVVTPAQEGTMGKLADRNPNVVSPTPASRLENIVRDQGPSPTQTGGPRNPIQGTMFDLGDSSILGNSAVDKKEVARALLQRRLEGGSTNPGETVRGLPGSRLDQNLDELLSSAGVNPAQVKQPLQAADLLQNFQGAPGTGGNRPTSALDATARPLRAIGMRASAATQEQYFKEIADALAHPTPERLRALQEIAMFDPAVRKLLTAQGAMLPFTQQKEQ